MILGLLIVIAVGFLAFYKRPTAPTNQEMIDDHYQTVALEAMRTGRIVHGSVDERGKLTMTYDDKPAPKEGE